jgi:hypothetical protein
MWEILMPRFACFAFAATLTAFPALADEFTDTLEGAIKAYREGDVSGAREDLDYASKLLTAMKSEALEKFLPAALPGWSREAAAEDAAAAGGFMGMLGGGTSAAATYIKGTESLTITLVADSPMVNGLGAMISGMAGLGGKPLRIQRTEFTAQDDGLQGVVNDRVMVSVTGDAPLEDMIAHLEAIDFKALGTF